jgi:N-acyl homoserine lactone hydrolase
MWSKYFLQQSQTLKDQLESLGVKPDEITYVAISHAHGDHIGNAKLFAKSKILMRKLEREFAMNTPPKPLNDDQKIEMLSGDRDVFGDGSLTIISTPGHTPGRQSLLVKLSKTGALILTSDLVRFRHMWDNKVVPPFNFNKEQSLASIERIIKLVAQHKAQLWTATTRTSPPRSTVR